MDKMGRGRREGWAAAAAAICGVGKRGGREMTSLSLHLISSLPPHFMHTIPSHWASLVHPSALLPIFFTIGRKFWGGV
jgi:hypothetical protein